MKKYKILIIGCGLITGSIFKNLIESSEIEVVDIDQSTREFLVQDYGIKTYKNINESQNNYDFIIIGLYPTKIITYIKDYLGYFKHQKVFDVSGVQLEISKQKDFFQEHKIEYIQTHPMAGREVVTFASAQKELFRDRNIIIHNLTASDKFEQKVVEMYKQIGAKVFSNISPREHDKIITYTSQLPHIISLAYTRLFDQFDSKQINQISANSFDEFARISNINIEMWKDVFLSNRLENTKALDEIINNLSELRESIKNEENNKLAEEMQISKNVIQRIKKEK